VLEQGLCYCLPRREWLCHGDIENESLCIDIANVDTTLVSEENVIAFTCRRDTDVIFSVGRVRKERFDNEVVQGPSDRFNLTEKRRQKMVSRG
jgi:hypothetical protein